MSQIIVGLGNPGSEYENTRHNTGRLLVEAFRNAHGFSEWELNKAKTTLVASGKLNKQSVTLLLPENYMNNSGKTLKPYIKSAKDIEKLIVVYDDLDLPLGSIKISFNRGSGGHNGVESIIKALRSKKFIRIRVGVSPQNEAGGTHKPLGEDRVLNFLMSAFSASEQTTLHGVEKKVNDAIEVMLREGVAAAMNRFN